MSKSLLFGVYDKVAQKYIGLEVSDSGALCKRSFYIAIVWLLLFPNGL